MFRTFLEIHCLILFYLAFHVMLHTTYLMYISKSTEIAKCVCDW